MTSTTSLKAKIDFRLLVQEIGLLTKGSKTICPYHDDHRPSLHLYEDGFFCFVCGASGDHYDWLMTTQALSFQEAANVLVRHVGMPSHLAPMPSPARSSGDKPLKMLTSEWRLPLRQHQLETHKRRAARLTKVPEALKGRGFTLTDCRQLEIVNENGNAIFPVIGPSGLVLTLKCRYALPDPHRYEYVTPGRGTPAWCSPDIRLATTILIIEGELNGMICWLTLGGKDNQIGVMGTAGTNGLLHLDVLENKVVYVYTDGDKTGHEAKQRWAKQALGADTKEVYLLEPWPIDACDIAGALGKAALRKRLTWTKKHSFTQDEAIDAVDVFSATHAASKNKPFLSPKPALMQWCRRFRSTPSLGPNLPHLDTLDNSTFQHNYHDVT